MAEPRAITTTMEWRAVNLITPQMCMCGHLHYARQEFLDGVQTRLAPQWKWCEKEGCECRGLQV